MVQDFQEDGGAPLPAHVSGRPKPGSCALANFDPTTKRLQGPLPEFARLLNKIFCDIRSGFANVFKRLFE
jgi:hypothetical protein